MPYRHGNDTDKDLVYFAKGGNGEAFGELVRRHHRFCLGLATRILRDRADAEDEAQNAYWDAFQHLHQFRGEAEFAAWLARIVVNHCLMVLRARRRARFLHLDAAAPGSSRRRLDLPSWRLDPEGEAGNRQLREVLDKEIRGIPSLLREVVLLHDVQELPIGEVAGRLGISVAASKSRLLRARVELRQRILRHCGRSGRASLTIHRKQDSKLQVLARP